MEVLNPTDILFCKAAACGAAAYFTNAYIQNYRKKPAEPLLLPRHKEKHIEKQQVPLTPTRSISKALQQSSKRCMVFYGSQTGTAERLAHQFSKEAKTRFDVDCLVADLDDYNYDDLLALSRSNVIVFLLATYGEGEATDNAIMFHRFLDSLKNGSVLENSTLHYAGFGLGNSSYQKYNEMIKFLDSALSRTSATRISPIGFGDDGKGTLADDFICWKESTLYRLANHFGLTERPFQYEPSFSIRPTNSLVSARTFLGEPNKKHFRDKVKGPYTLQNPYPAPIVEARNLCARGSRQFVHLEFDLSQSTLSYEAGDHLAVRPSNSSREVDRFLQVFGLLPLRHAEIEISSFDAALKIPVPTLTTYDALARYYLDICAPVTRQTLNTVSRFVSEGPSKSRLQYLSANSEAFSASVVEKKLNLAQVLQSCTDGLTQWDRIPFSVLLESIPIIKPRYYSISSSPLVSRTKVSITCVVESSEVEGTNEIFKGVATNYLLALSSSSPKESSSALAATEPTHQIKGPRERYTTPTALISLRRSTFKLPRDSSIPVIMIGPGTGVAPFRGFLQSRVSQARDGRSVVGRTLLYYGCRGRNEDFLYRDEWEDMKQILTPEVFSMQTAFSRESNVQKTYVQDLLQRDNNPEELRDLILNQNAHVYVCGDASRMARDVWKAMIQILADGTSTETRMTATEQYMHDMKASGRWLEDVW